MLNFADPTPLFESPRPTENAPIDVSISRGAIREAHFTSDEQLLLLTGRGVDIYDPKTLEMTGRWLEETCIETLLPIGDDQFVVVAFTGNDRALYRVAFGEELGDDFLRVGGYGMKQIGACATAVAVPKRNGVDIHDFTGKQIASFEIEDERIKNRHLHQAGISADGTIAIACGGWTAFNAWHIETGESLLALDSFDAPNDFLLDGHNLIATASSGYNIYTLKNPANPRYVSGQNGKLIAGAQRFIQAGNLAEYRELDLETGEFSDEVAPFEKHYGSMSGGIGAVSKNYLALFAGSYGTLLVNDKKLEGFSLTPKTFAVSSDTRRIVAHSEWGHGKAVLIDRDSKTIRTVTHRDGMIASSISADGQTVILPTGNNLKPRAVFTAPFDGDGEPVAGPKLLPFVRKTVPISDNLYAANAYKLSDSGFLGVYKLGSNRAVMKLKEADARTFEISNDGSRAIIGWSSGEVATHDLTSKGKKIESWPQRPTSVAVSADRAAFVYRKDDETILSLHGDSETEVPISLGSGGGMGTPAMSFSPDGKTLFVGTFNGDLQVRDGANGELQNTIPLHAGVLTQMQFAGGLLWTLGTDGFIHGVDVGVEGGESRAALDDLEPEAAPMAPTEPFTPPDGLQPMTPERPDAKSVEPYSTDWAKTPFPLFLENLKAAGFVHNKESEHATNAMDFYAPDLSVVVVEIDEEHGCATATFREWDGTIAGGPEMKLGDVDELLFAFVFAAIRDAYSEDT